MPSKPDSYLARIRAQAIIIRALDAAGVLPEPELSVSERLRLELREATAATCASVVKFTPALLEEARRAIPFWLNYQVRGTGSYVGAGADISQIEEHEGTKLTVTWNNESVTVSWRSLRPPAPAFLLFIDTTTDSPLAIVALTGLLQGEKNWSFVTDLGFVQHEVAWAVRIALDGEI